MSEDALNSTSRVHLEQRLLLLVLGGAVLPPRNRGVEGSNVPSLVDAASKAMDVETGTH